MANLGNRTRPGRHKKPEPKWIESLTPDQALQQYGRCICFRVAHLERRNVFEFYCIPFDFGDNQQKNLCDGEEQPPPPTGPTLPTGIKPFETCWDIPWASTFAAAGSSLYCFGGTQCTDSGSRESLSSAIYCYDYEHNSESIEVGRWYTHSGYQMTRARFDPQIINIQGRMLLISGGGGTDKTLEDDDSWVEAFDPNSKSCSPESSMPIELRRSPLLTADLRSCNQILVASASRNAAFVFDVTTLVWKKFDQSDEFVFGKVTGHCRPFSCMEDKAAVVRDTILCWFGKRGNVLLAYDLNLKTWFETPIKGLKKVGKLMPDLYDNDFSLLPLDYEHICLLWLCYSPVTFDRVLHCIKVLVSIYHAKEHPTFRASVISYQSYVLKESSSYIEAVVLQRNAFETTALQDSEPKEGRAAAMATTKVVGKRTPKTGSTKGERTPKIGSSKGERKLFHSLNPEQHGRTICFRASHYSTRLIDFYCIPVDDDFDHAADDYQPPERYGTPRKRIFPFQSSTNMSWTSSFAAVGKSMYCVGGHDVEGRESSAIYHFDTTGGCKGIWYPNSFDMCCTRVVLTTIAMDMKLFVIGGQADDGAPLAEVFDPSSKSSLVVESPPASLDESRFLVTAALRDRNQILVACPYAKDAYLFDVKTGAWVQVDYNIDFAAFYREAAVVLKTILCWCDDGLQMLLAYDLNLKRWFKTSIKHLKRVGRRLKDKELSKFSLFTLDENHLCLLWVDHVNHRFLHCTKVSVSLSDNRFRAAVALSRSYVLRDGSHFIDGLLLDLTSIPEEGSTSSDAFSQQPGEDVR